MWPDIYYLVDTAATRGYCMQFHTAVPSVLRGIEFSKSGLRERLLFTCIKQKEMSCLV